MKKLFLASLFILVGSGHAFADLFQTIEDKSYMVKYNVSTAANTSTAAVIVDLSNTTSWPHRETGEINISNIRLDLDKVAASTATVRLGVVNFVSVSSGSITWFWSKTSNLNVSNTNITDNVASDNTLYRLRVNPLVPVPLPATATEGATPYILSNNTSLGSTAYQTDVTMPSLFATGATPGVGDLIMEVGAGSGAVQANLSVTYHTRKR